MSEERTVEEFGKLRANLRHLWDFSTEKEIDRDTCRNIVLEIRKSIKIIWSSLEDLLLDRTSNLPLDKTLLIMLLAKKAPEQMIRDAFKTMPFEYDTSSLISQLDHPELYDDKRVKDSLTSYVESLEVELARIEEKLGIKHGLSQIAEVITSFPYFTQEWAVAMCYLSAMEITLNKKLPELGLTMNGAFKERYEKGLQELKKKKVEVSMLEKQLPKLFWDMRNRVVHQGYAPNKDELDLMTKYVTKALKLLYGLP